MQKANVILSNQLTQTINTAAFYVVFSLVYDVLFMTEERRQSLKVKH